MLIVPGMLPALAEGLHVTLPVAGQLVTAFAFTVCVGAPLLAGAALVWSFVPAGLRVQRVDARVWREILGNRAILAVLAVTALQSAPQFAILAYIVPATMAFLEVSPTVLGLLLACFGVVGV